MPDKLERQVAHLNQHPEHGLVYGDITAFCDGAVETVSYFAERPPHEGRVFQKLLEQNFITNVTVLVRKSCLEAIGGYDESLRTSEDYELWLRFCREFPVGYVPEVLVKVRRHAGNLTRDDCDTHRDHLLVLDRITARFRGSIPRPLVRQAYAQTYFKLGCGHLRSRRFPLAKEALLQSWRYNPVSWSLYRYLAASMLPEPVLNHLLNQREDVRRPNGNGSH